MQRLVVRVNVIVMLGISRKYWLIVAALMLGVAMILYYVNLRSLICACGYVKLWEGEVNSPGNSQHIADWYTPSHIIHGFLFYALMQWRLPQRPLGERLAIVAGIELVWEMVENSPAIINRYREATMAAGYSGDSILNSMADCSWMIIGFLAAARLPWKVTLGLALAFELATLFIIRDNLTLNVLMLLWPIGAIKAWQAAL